jgi:hypothetical protein
MGCWGLIFSDWPFTCECKSDMEIFCIERDVTMLHRLLSVSSGVAICK